MTDSEKETERRRWECTGIKKQSHRHGERWTLSAHSKRSTEKELDTKGFF